MPNQLPEDPTTPIVPSAPDRPTRASEPAALMLNPAVRVLWRGADCVQLELGDRAVTLSGVDGPLIAGLVTRPGDRAAMSATPRPDARAGPDPVARLGPASADTLTEAGFTWIRGEVDDPRLAAPLPRLAGQLTTLSARFGPRAAEVLATRRFSAVTVHGAGPVAAHVAALLAAAGVGRVHLPDGGAVRLHQAQPGGLTPGDEGRPFADAGPEAVHRAAPDVDLGPLPPDDRPDLVVLAVDEPVDPERRAALLAAEWAHLAVSIGIEHGVVGPLVIPGLTSCLDCLDHHRRDRDPGWPALALQLGTARRHPPGSDVALNTVVAGVAALQALAYLDGEDPATVDGTLELRLPDWRLRRRSWPAHPDCRCRDPARRPDQAQDRRSGHNGTGVPVT